MCACASVSWRSVMGVRIQPGATALTRMPCAADLGRQRLRQLDDGRLGDAVAEQAGAAGVDGARGHGDDAAPGVPGDHRAGGLLAGVQHSLEVDVQDPVEVLVPGLQDRAAVHDPGDGRHHVQALAGRPTASAELGAVGDVEGVGVGRAARVLDDGLAVSCEALARRGPRSARWRPPRRAVRPMARPMPLAAPVTNAVRPVRSYAVRGMTGTVRADSDGPSIGVRGSARGFARSGVAVWGGARLAGRAPVGGAFAGAVALVGRRGRGCRSAGRGGVRGRTRTGRWPAAARRGADRAVAVGFEELLGERRAGERRGRRGGRRRGARG